MPKSYILRVRVRESAQRNYAKELHLMIFFVKVLWKCYGHYKPKKESAQRNYAKELHLMILLWKYYKNIMDITFFNIKVFFFLIQTNYLDSINDKSYTKPNFNKNGFKNQYG